MDNELKNYRHNTIQKFLCQILELNQSESDTSAIAIEQALNENALSKLVHFFDYITQCTDKNSNTSHCQNRNSSCANTNNCSSCCGNCNKN